MSTSPGELDRFLADLSGRRQRLLELVGTEDSERAELLAELNQLSEQLVVADEQLRVQQEELEATRRRMDALAEDWSALFELSTAALVLTDEHGLVLSTTRAAQLMLQPAVQARQRPIVTWFEVADRRRVRDVISRREDGEELVLERVRLRRSDGSTSLVDVTFTPTQAPTWPGLVLRWELRLVDPALAVVDPLSAPMPDLAQELTALTTRLAPLTTVPAVLEASVAEAVQLIPGAQLATVVEKHRRGPLRVLAMTGSQAVAASPHVLRTPLGLQGFGLTELRVSGPRPWGPDATSLAGLLAVHFRVAMAHVRQRQNLEHALDTRQLIGQAVGVLVERRRLTASAAFEELAQRSQLANLKLHEIARIVVETGQDPHQISGR
jgi:PAS domain S-box-containing protein